MNTGSKPRRVALCWLLAFVSACGAQRPRPSSEAPAPRVAAPAHAARYTRYAVAADHPEASAAGAEILAAGGTAADAAAAVMLALGVASPAASGLGGGGFALYYRARDRSLTYLDFRERAPAAATPDMLAPPPGSAPGTAPTVNAPGAPQRAVGLAVGVPGEPRGIEELLRRFGTLPRAQVVAPAVRLAEEGFTPTEYLAGLSQRFLTALRGDPLGRSWVPEGAPGIRAGERLRNPALAATLRRFAEEGARVFYEGALAAEIVRATQGAGGRLGLDDLRGYTVAERRPLQAMHFGHRWVTAPPESAGGFTLVQGLALLERWRPAPDEAALLHAFAESWKGPFVDRARYFGDPDAVTVPLDALLAPTRLDARAARFDPQRARPAMDYDLPLPDSPSRPAVVPPGQGTSHLCVVDAEGNIASVTTTVNIPFGAGISVGGFWLNDELDDFTAVPPGPEAPVLPGGAANLPGAGRRPVSSMTPTIVFAGDEPVLCVGGSGGTRITTAVTQAAYRAIVLGMPVGEAVVHPRVHQAATPATLGVEPAAGASVMAALRARGHTVEPLANGAIVQMIRLTRSGEGWSLEAASDPRKNGRPAGR